MPVRLWHLSGRLGEKEMQSFDRAVGADTVQRVKLKA